MLGSLYKGSNYVGCRLRPLIFGSSQIAQSRFHSLGLQEKATPVVGPKVPETRPTFGFFGVPWICTLFTLGLKVGIIFVLGAPEYESMFKPT